MAWRGEFGFHSTVQLQITPRNCSPDSRPFESFHSLCFRLLPYRYWMPDHLAHIALRLRCLSTNHLFAAITSSAFPLLFGTTAQLNESPQFDLISQAAATDRLYHRLTQDYVFSILTHDGTQLPAPHGLRRDHFNHHHPSRRSVRCRSRPSHVAAYSGPKLSCRRRCHLDWAGK